MNKPREPFEELVIPRKELPKLGGRYRVYKDAADYITVEAGSALEAIKQCGLPKIYRLERDAIYLSNVLNLEALANIPAPTATAAETPVAASTEAAEAAPAPETQTPAIPPATDLSTEALAKVDAPLSGADVDKLLQN